MGNDQTTPRDNSSSVRLEANGVLATDAAASRIPVRWTPELQGIARIIFGFLIIRHGMEQVFGFPDAAIDAPTVSLFGALKLLCLPGGALLMLGLITRPTALVLAGAHVLYWFAEPLPQAVFEGARLFGSGGAPSDHVLLPGLFCAYLFYAGGGALSLDRFFGLDDGVVVHPRAAAYALTVLRVVAGVLFIFHGTGKIAPTLDPVSLRALAMVLELVGGPLFICGLFTRPVAFILSGEMAFAYFMSHAPDGFWESFARPNQEASILFCYLFLFYWAAGAGPYSLDAVRQRRRGRSASAPVTAPSTA